MPLYLTFPGSLSRSEEHTSELQSQFHLVCRLLLEKYGDHPELHSLPTRRSSDLKHQPKEGRTTIERHARAAVILASIAHKVGRMLGRSTLTLCSPRRGFAFDALVSHIPRKSFKIGRAHV